MSKYPHYDNVVKNLKRASCYIQAMDATYRSEEYLSRAEKANIVEEKIANAVYARIYNLIASLYHCADEYPLDGLDIELMRAVDEYQENLKTHDASYQNNRFQAVVKDFNASEITNENLVVTLLQAFGSEHILTTPKITDYSQLPAAIDLAIILGQEAEVQPTGEILETNLS